MYRVGIIGCGGIAQVHAAALQQLPQIEMIACADRNHIPQPLNITAATLVVATCHDSSVGFYAHCML